MSPRRYELSDFEWSIIQPLLPNKPRGVPRADDREVLNGVYWRLRTGSPGADILERYGPATTYANRFRRWAKSGVWSSASQQAQALQGLRDRLRKARRQLSRPRQARRLTSLVAN